MFLESALPYAGRFVAAAYLGAVSPVLAFAGASVYGVYECYRTDPAMGSQNEVAVGREFGRKSRQAMSLLLGAGCMLVWNGPIDGILSPAARQFLGL